MPDDARLRDRIRAYLGVGHIVDHLHRMEHQMTTFLTLLQGLADQQSAASAAQQASFLNLHNAIGRLEQSVTDLQQALQDAQGGQVTPEVQAAAAGISVALGDMKTAADTADDGFEPVTAPVEPTTPVEPGPVLDEPTA